MTKEEFIDQMAEGVKESEGDPGVTLGLAEEAGLDFGELHKMSDKWYPLGYPTAKQLGEILENTTVAIEADPRAFAAAASGEALLRAVRCPDERSATGLFEIRGIGATYLLEEIPEEMLLDLQIEGMPPQQLEDVSGVISYEMPIEALEEGEGVRVLVSLFPGFSQKDGTPDFHWRIMELVGSLFTFSR